MSNPWKRRAERARVELEGKPVVVPAYPEWVFHIRPLSAYSPAYQAAVKRISQRKEVAAYLKRAGKPGYVQTAKDAEIDATIIREAFGEACVASWDGVTDENGEPLKCSPAAANKILAFFPDIYHDLQAFASNESNFQPLDGDEKEDLVAGN